MEPARTAWITGGAGAIGQAVCRRLSSAGMKIGILDRAGEALASIGAAVAGVGVGCDLADSGDVARGAATLIEQLGPADILVNVAGISHDDALVDLPQARWDALIAVNLTAPFLLAQIVLPGMMERRLGRIVNVSSNAGVIPVARRAAYCTAKAGLDALTRSIALEGGPSGVTANTVSPGFIDTPMSRGAFGGRAGLEAAVRGDFRNPMALVLEPDDIAAAIAFFCHPDAHGITGQRLHVDAGMVMP
jgi:NAD(P)-dependent dehydrogenase (short-subunit alcohol dehydrogenase family)